MNCVNKVKVLGLQILNADKSAFFAISLSHLHIQLINQHMFSLIAE